MLITFEGIEGCGKSTQAVRVREWLQSMGRSVLLSREPGGTAVGRTLRSLLLDAQNNHLCSRTELFLYLADRAQHVHEIIKPGLEAGSVVLVDRFADSTLVYQGFGRGLDLHMVQGLNELAVDRVTPDLTLVLDLSPETGLQRARSRNGEQGTDQSEGRFEAESLAFHSRIREGYLELASRDRERIVVVNGAGTEDEVYAQVQKEIESRLLSP
ncbi:dTMP kinase [Desulfovermiculus halophilus]|jgi:dTMP kinase|uniref:dTMP kinase n=1 Tax=Desulfovermiculus halophilus TaxID=339722 RepID=UPI0004847E8D|nr:dTMP kinase [Desulfovermiculus halophilus]